MNKPDFRALGKYLWICIPLGVILATMVLWLWGLTPLTALIAVLSFVCPAILLWGALRLGRKD